MLKNNIIKFYIKMIFTNKNGNQINVIESDYNKKKNKGVEST